MVRLVRGRPTPRLQLEGMTQPERDSQQEEQPDATEGKVIADYDPDVDYVGLEPKIEPVAHAKMEMPRDGTLRQRMMPQE